MGLLGGIVGAILGAVVGVLFVEVIFANNQSWPDLVPVALAVVGAFAGTQLGRRFGQRTPAAH